MSQTEYNFMDALTEMRGGNNWSGVIVSKTEK